MVSATMSRLKFLLTLLSQTVLLFYAVAVQASAFHLAPGLEITLPDSLALEVIAPHDQFNGPIIVGEVEGEPGYFIAATKVKTWEKNSVLWKRLESELRKRSSTNVFIPSHEGKFFTNLNDKVWFKAYAYNTAEQAHHQVYFLLKNQRTTYWITLTMVEGVDINLAIPLAKTLLQRAHIIALY